MADVVLGGQQGASSCVGDGAARVCTSAMGTSTSRRFEVPVRDNATGARGSLKGNCSVMYSGTTITYAAKSGRSDATGSVDCDLEIAFADGAVFGGMHQQRVLADNVEKKTFAFTFTRGTGRFEGFSAAVTREESKAWTPPEPIGDKGGNDQKPTSQDTGPNRDKGPASGNDTGQDKGSSPGTSTTATTTASGIVRTLQRALRAQARPRGDGGGDAMRIPSSATPMADVTSLGLLVPGNRASRIVIAAPVGARCQGTLGAKALPSITVRAGRTGTLMKVLSAGEVSVARTPFALTVRCNTSAGQTIVVKRVLRPFSVGVGKAAKA